MVLKINKKVVVKHKCNCKVRHFVAPLQYEMLMFGEQLTYNLAAENIKK